LRSHIKGLIKYHHEFKVAVSDCPNACSLPQIQDIGIIGAVLPKIADIYCTGCETCSRNCQEHASVADNDIGKPMLDFQACVKCGQFVEKNALVISAQLVSNKQYGFFKNFHIVTFPKEGFFSKSADTITVEMQPGQSKLHPVELI